MKRNIGKELESKIGSAYELVSQANNAMINCIIDAIKESEDKEISYDEHIDNSCGYTETRTIKYNEDGDLVMFDDCGNEIANIEDMTTNELYDICLRFY